MVSLVILERCCCFFKCGGLHCSVFSTDSDTLLNCIWFQKVKVRVFCIFWSAKSKARLNGKNSLKWRSSVYLCETVGGDIIFLVFHIPGGSFNKCYLFCFSILAQSFIFLQMSVLQWHIFPRNSFLHWLFYLQNWLDILWILHCFIILLDFLYLRKNRNWFNIAFILHLLNKSALRASACSSVGWQSGTGLLTLWCTSSK